MRLAPGKDVEWIDGEAVILDAETGQLHHLNQTAAIVYALFEEYGFEGGLKEAEARFGSKPAIEAQMKVLVADMIKRGLLLDD